MGTDYFTESEPYLIIDDAGAEVAVVDLHHKSMPSGSKVVEGFIFRIPLPWNRRATIECPSALKIANLLWYRAGLTKRRTVTLPSTLLKSHGINRWAKYRSLQALESAGLVKFQKSDGRSTQITLLDVVENSSITDAV